MQKINLIKLQALVRTKIWIRCIKTSHEGQRYLVGIILIILYPSLLHRQSNGLGFGINMKLLVNVVDVFSHGIGTNK